MATVALAPALLLLLASCCAVALARDLYVGGGGGWTDKPAEPFNSWAERNRFQINDRLVFRYGKAAAAAEAEDSVLVVSQSQYDACNTTGPLLRVRVEEDGGYSVFVLGSSGPFFFISGDAHRCQAGKRVVVVVPGDQSTDLSPAAENSSSASPSTHVAEYVVNPLDPGLDWYKPYDKFTFDVASGNYRAFMGAVYRCLIRGSRNRVGDTYMLQKQTGPNARPTRWLLVELVHEEDKIMLAMRPDNLYITGFTNAAGRWFIFNNIPRNIIPIAYPYRGRDDYGYLIGGHRSLEYVHISRLALAEALRQIATYETRELADVGCVSRALAIMAATFAEASRFAEIAEAVDRGLNDRRFGADLGSLYKLVVKWRDLSCAILIARQNNGRWGSAEAQRVAEDLGVRSQAEALNKLRVLLWPGNNACSQRITGLTQ